MVKRANNGIITLFGKSMINLVEIIKMINDIKSKNSKNTFGTIYIKLSFFSSTKYSLVCLA